tara:strand:+ start:157 stop:432 length:276 start_codon:yes stop_codon:yes gene_type:complete
MTCEHCNLKKDVLHKDDICTIVLRSEIPTIVLNRHANDPSEDESEHLDRMLWAKGGMWYAHQTRVMSSEELKVEKTEDEHLCWRLVRKTGG